METKLSNKQRKICLNTKKYLKTARLSLYLLPLPLFIFVFGVIKFRLYFPKDDFIQFIVFGLVCSITMGQMIAILVIAPIIEKLFKIEEGAKGIKLSTCLNEKEQNICKNSKRTFIKSLWFTSCFSITIVSGAVVLIRCRPYLLTYEFLVLYIALVVFSILAGWHIGTLRYSPILAKLYRTQQAQQAGGQVLTVDRLEAGKKESK